MSANFGKNMPKLIRREAATLLVAVGKLMGLVSAVRHERRRSAHQLPS